MKSNVFSTCELILLAVFTVQFSSVVLSAPTLNAEYSYEDRRAKWRRDTCSPLPGPGSPAKEFALLTYTLITNTGTALTINGNIGVSPSGSTVGLLVSSVIGTVDINDATAASAIAEASTACNGAAAAMPRTTVVGTSITGSTFTPGNYYFPAAANLAASGTTTFDAGGNPNAQFIMILEGAVTTGASSTIALLGGAKACNIYWVVGAAPAAGAAITLGATSTFNGNACVWGAITAGANVVVKGLLVTLPDAAASVITIAGGVFNADDTC